MDIQSSEADQNEQEDDRKGSPMMMEDDYAGSLALCLILKVSCARKSAL